MIEKAVEDEEQARWAQVIGLAQQGDKRMLARILQAFDGKLRKIAHAAANNGFADDGEQIERIAVLTAVQAWGERQDFEHLPAFIVSKSYTAICTERRRQKREKEMTCPYEVGGGCEFSEEVLTADAAQTARNYFAEERHHDVVEEVLAKLELLTPRQEELIVLHYLEGWSNGDLAHKYQVSPAAISKTIKKGLTKLRQLLLAAHQAEKQREAEELLM